MIVRFLDHQDDQNPANGLKFNDSSSVLRLLKDSMREEPFLCQFKGENGCNIMIGLGGSHNCLQYTHNNGNGPYMMAVGQHGKKGYMSFLTADIATPISENYDIPFDLVEKIVSHFVETGDRWPHVAWAAV